MADTTATNARTVTIDLPDYGGEVVYFNLLTAVAISGAEVMPRKSYTVTLDSAGVGSVDLPTPDATGDAAWLWTIRLPDRISYEASLAYDAASISLADWLVADVTTETANAVQNLVAAKADKDTDATDNNLAIFDTGQPVDSGIPASSAAEMFGAIKQAATTSATGVVEAATQAEVNTGEAGKYLDAATFLGADYHKLPGAMRLGAAITGASTTTAVLRTTPDSAVQNIGEWVIVGAYSTDAELATINASGAVAPVAGGAFANSHSVDALVVPVQDKRLNVRMFGALGDGATDDSAAIQATINAAASIVDQFTGTAADGSARGTTVILPAAVYMVESTITLYNYVDLRGHGQWATLIYGNVGTANDILSITSGTDYKNIRISDMRIRGGAADGSTSFVGNARDGLHIERARVMLDNVQVDHVDRYCLYADYVIQSQFMRCMFANALYTPVYINDTIGASTTLTMVNSYFTGGKNGPGFKAEDIYGAAAIGCVFESNGEDTPASGHGAQIVAGSMTFTGCYFENNACHDLYLGSGADAPLSQGSGNSFVVTNPTIVGGIWQDLAEPSIRFTEGSTFIVDGGKFVKQATTQVLIESESHTQVNIRVPVLLARVSYVGRSSGAKTLDAVPNLLVDTEDNDMFFGRNTDLHAGRLSLQTDSASSDLVLAELYRHATASINTYLGVRAYIDNDASAKTGLAELRFYLNTKTAGAERGDLHVYTRYGGADVLAAVFTNNSIKPKNLDGGYLPTTDPADGASLWIDTSDGNRIKRAS